MSFMEKIFGTPKVQPTNPAPGPTNPAPGQTTNNLNTNPAPAQTQQTQQTDANGVVPKADHQQSPDDKFAKLWEPSVPPKEDPNAPKPLSAQAMMEAAGKVDFTKVLNPEDLAAISKGGDDAVKALAVLLNKTAQTVYGQSLVVANELVDRKVQEAEATFASRVPGLVKQSAAGEQLLQNNPALKDPAVAPVVAAIQKQLMTRYPSASATELQQLAAEYFSSAAKKFAPAPKETAPAESADNFNWEEWATKDLKLG